MSVWVHRTSRRYVGARQGSAERRIALGLMGRTDVRHAAGYSTGKLPLLAIDRRIRHCGYVNGLRTRAPVGAKWSTLRETTTRS